MQGVGRWATTSFAGGGLGLAWRSGGAERYALALAAGSLDGSFAGRGELTFSYYLEPARRSGVTPYATGGVAIEAVSGAQHGTILLALGVESRPALRFGWFLEAGVSGGVRVAAGFRWRRRP